MVVDCITYIFILDIGVVWCSETVPYTYYYLLAMIFVVYTYICSYVFIFI